MDLGLERVSRLLENLRPSSEQDLATSSSSSPIPAPHRAFPLIHVAGTNGKGSVCAYIASALQASGLRVGRYNSPHLVTPRDTIQINNTPIAETDFNHVQAWVAQQDAELGLESTSFERLTAAAFYWFAYGPRPDLGSQGSTGYRANVDVAVIEVGVGGRLDATNVVEQPQVCVITSIGMDHVGLLGNTIGEVVFEKAGIIKQGVPVVVAPQSSSEADKVYQVIEEKAHSVGLNVSSPNSQLTKVQAAHWIDHPSSSSEVLLDLDPGRVGHWAALTRPINQSLFEFWIPLLGDFQLENAATAIAALQVLRAEPTTGDGADQWRQQITDDTIRQGIASTVWPGRLQWIEADAAPSEVRGRLLVDGAHNPAAAIALKAYVDSQVSSSPSSSRKRTHWIMAFTKGKDIEEMFDILFTPPTSLPAVEPDTFTAVEFSPPEGMPWVSSIPTDEVCRRLQVQQERFYSDVCFLRFNFLGSPFKCRFAMTQMAMTAVNGGK
ncbi:hypothetical protein BGW38_007514, partial [Lunasporangiospora selenospora]